MLRVVRPVEEKAILSKSSFILDQNFIVLVLKFVRKLFHFLAVLNLTFRGPSSEVTNFERWILYAVLVAMTALIQHILFNKLLLILVYFYEMADWFCLVDFKSYDFTQLVFQIS